MEMKIGNYLVYVKREKDGHDIDALEWNEREGWITCYKEGSTWFDSKRPFDFDEEDYAGLLKHFALQYWRDEFPLSRILVMSPAELIGARRDKEIKMRLDERHEAFRSGSTQILPAENFG